MSELVFNIEVDESKSWKENYFMLLENFQKVVDWYENERVKIRDEARKAIDMLEAFIAQEKAAGRY